MLLALICCNFAQYYYTLTLLIQLMLCVFKLIPDILWMGVRLKKEEF
jgi:hypothetical protein